MRDKGRIKIILKTAHNGQKRKYKFEIDVREGKDRFHCHHGDPAFVAAALLNTDIRHFSGLARRKLLRKFSDYIDVAVHDFTVEERKSGSIFDVSMETAGPGDGIVTKAPGIVVKWKIDCKLGLAGWYLFYIFNNRATSISLLFGDFHSFLNLVLDFCTNCATQER